MVNNATLQSLPTYCGVSALQPRWAQHDAMRKELAPHDIHLWAIDLAQLHATPYSALLHSAEQARAARYRDRAAQIRYRRGRIGLRILLNAYTGLANDDLGFGYGDRGKPALQNELPGGEFCFNYTLSGDKALYALAWNRQLGIDLETLPRKINAQLLAKRKLAAAERQAWQAVAPPWQERAMLACWTRKEAYGKALGVGIRYTINQVPMFVDLNSPFWHCRVSGLFGDSSGERDGQILHGMQIAPPFPGIAALVHDGNALNTPLASPALQAWQWTPATASSHASGQAA